jgi:hypothetical protein
MSRLRPLRLLALSVVYFVALLIGGAVSTAFGLPEPDFGEKPSDAMLALMATGFALCGGVGMSLLAPMAQGSFARRWAILGVFFYVAHGLNNTIEAAMFTEYGGTAAMLVSIIVPAIAVSAFAVWLCPAIDRGSGDVPALPHWLPPWSWRIGAAVLAFPVIYLAFGMLVSGQVVPIYLEEGNQLQIPAMSTIVVTQLIRGPLYLVVCLPFVLQWRGSRREFVLRFATGFFLVSSLAGLVSAYWMPSTIRIFHGIELAGDCVAWAALLAWLWLDTSTARVSNEPAAATAGVG